MIDATVVTDIKQIDASRIMGHGNPPCRDMGDPVALKKRYF